MDKKDLLIVACIPSYFEENTIAKVILSSQKYVDKVIVCDDGSTDMTGEIAQKLGAFVIKHKKNLGKGHAIKTLLASAMEHDADIVVLIDGDGQHNPIEIPDLIEPILKSKADLVVGSRYLNKSPLEASWYRRSGLRIMNFLHKRINKLDISDAECGFKALSRKALEAVWFFENEGYGVDAELLVLAKKNGINVVEVPVRVKYKGLPNTSKKIPLFHGGELISNLLRTLVEERPLKYLGLPGSVLLFIGIAAAVYVTLAYNESGGRLFSLIAMLITVGSTISGLVLVVAALMLWSLQKLSNRISDLKRLRVTSDFNEENKK